MFEILIGIVICVIIIAILILIFVFWNNRKCKKNDYSIEKELLNNKTFLLTLENLRINGNIDDIEYWFDGIYGEKGYQNLINNLYELKELQNKKGFLIERKINKLAIKLIKISDQFNKNSNLKA